MDNNSDDDSWYYGAWPSLAGFAFGIGVIVLMFAVATGMH